MVSQLQGESAPHAEADDANFSGAIRARKKERSSRGNVVEGLPLSRCQRAKSCHQTPASAAPTEQVGHQNDVTGAAQALNLCAHVFFDSEDLMNHDRSGKRSRALRNRQHTPKLAVAIGCRDCDVGELHDLSLYC